MLIQWRQPCYSDGSPVAQGDELEVSYPDIRPLPHRGLIYRFVEGSLGITDIEVIHSSKSGGGVCVVGWADFARQQQVRLRRRPLSPEHARQILQLATTALGDPYDALAANCEHFTDWCYNGVSGESPTLQAGVLVASGVALIFAALSTDRS
jgi:Lecithin retinol acyltransferase